MADLSDNARLVLGSSFGWGQVLTYHMVQSIPSPEMQVALDELVDAGFLVRQTGLPDMTAKAVRYSLADGVDVAPFRKEAWDIMTSDAAPEIRVFIPNPSPQPNETVKARQIADAIEACDWSDCSIGNKEILKSAVIVLRSLP